MKPFKTMHLTALLATKGLVPNPTQTPPSRTNASSKKKKHHLDKSTFSKEIFSITWSSQTDKEEGHDDYPSRSR